MMDLGRWVTDKCHMAFIRFRIFFTKDDKLKKELTVASALYTKKGRNILANAMVKGFCKATVVNDYES
ncbi:MAG: hypothetical protein WC375_05640 [Methanomassiliicoccales archaeon]|jgi:hypothetical protein